MSQCSREAAKTEQKPQSVKPTFQEREQARRKETDGRRSTGRSTGLKEHALRKKEQATKHEATARREADRLDMNLQKRLLDRYGYGRYCSPSSAIDSPDIELTPILLAKEIEIVPKEGGSRSPAATMSLTARAEHDFASHVSGDESRDPSVQELSDAGNFKGKGKLIDKRRL